MKSGTKRQWLLPVFIVSCVLGLFLIGSKPGSPAKARAERQTGTEGEILVVPVQIERDSYGIAMVDTAGQTLWIYKLNSRGSAHNRLELLAARSWQYDRLLQQYNTTEPKPEQIKILLENWNRQQKKQDRKKQQDSDINILEIAEPNDSY